MPFPLRSAALGPSPLLPIHRRRRRPHTIAAITAPPSFSLHHSHRKNHLRAKLPQIPTPTPTSLHPCPPSIQEDRAPDETFGDESIGDERGEEDRGATEEDYSLLSEIKAPERTVESGTAGFNISKVLVNLSMCLTVVVVVRTVVWAVAALRGGDGVQERKKDGRVVRELKLLSLEDERKVEEIRALAKRVRGEEEEAMVGDGAGEAIIRNSVMEEIERRAERMKTKMGSEFQKKTEEDGEKMKMKMRELQKKVGDGVVAVGTRKSEGNNVRRKLAFRKMKVDIANRDRIKGFDGSEWRNQKVSNGVLPHLNDLENTMLEESLDTSVLPSKNSKDIKNNLDASVPDSNERSRSGHGVSVSGGTGKKDNAKEADAPITQSRNTNTELRSSTGANERRPDCKQLWWLKLPYVLCIFLRTGSEVDVDPDDPMKGLYAMKMDPDSDDSPSHVIVFQDHTDARNLCYLLESHFEVLGDFSTDIVPLPIKELEDVVMMNSLNVVVVKKAELRLYAGQPLLEVETAIRSIIRRNAS